MLPPPRVSEKLIKLFSIEKKSELAKYCSDLTITQEELVQLILWAPLIGYTHSRCHMEYQPAEAQFTDWDIETLASKDPRIRAESLPKIVNKIGNLFEVRKYVSAHLFVNESRWHLFYFSLRDVNNETENHWAHGSHVHFVNDLWPQYRLDSLEELLFSERKIKISDSIHIRFERLEKR